MLVVLSHGHGVGCARSIGLVCGRGVFARDVRERCKGVLGTRKRPHEFEGICVADLSPGDFRA